MAHTKAQKTVRGNRDSQSKRLGIKIFGGQQIKKGNIIVRQKGTKFYPGENTIMGKDFTIMANKDGIVKFYVRYSKKYVTVV